MATSNSKNIAEFLNGDTTITTTDIADDAATADKLANAINTSIAVGASALPKAGGTMTGDVTFADNIYAKFGTGNDLRIRHDGSNSYIAEMGTGNLIVQTNGADFLVENTDGDNMINAISDGAVELSHNNAVKLATTATGVAVTGGISLGGTGAANTLDDYEEGTWTPSFGGSSSNPTVNFNVAGGTYVKVGSLVTIGVSTTTVSVSGGSGGLFLNGLPFNKSSSASYGAVAAQTQNFNTLPSEPLRGYVVSDYVRFKYGNAVDVPTSVLRTSGDSNQIWMSFTYHTDS